MGEQEARRDVEVEVNGVLRNVTEGTGYDRTCSSTKENERIEMNALR